MFTKMLMFILLSLYVTTTFQYTSNSDRDCPCWKIKNQLNDRAAEKLNKWIADHTKVVLQLKSWTTDVLTQQDNKIWEQNSVIEKQTATISMLQQLINSTSTTVQPQVTSITEQMAEYQNNKVDRLQMKIWNMSDTLERLYFKAGEHEMMNQEYNSTITGLNTRLTKQNATITGLNTRLTKQNATITGLNTRLTEQNATMIGLNPRFTSLEDGITEQKATITGMNTRLTEQKATLTGLNIRLISMEARIKEQNATIIGENINLNNRLIEKNITIISQADTMHMMQSNMSKMGDVMNFLNNVINMNKRECGPAPNIMGGYVLFKNYFKNTVTYTCITGYELDTGSLTVECLNTGSWDTLPTCKEIKTCYKVTNGKEYDIINATVDISGTNKSKSECDEWCRQHTDCTATIYLDMYGCIRFGSPVLYVDLPSTQTAEQCENRCSRNPQCLSYAAWSFHICVMLKSLITSDHLANNIKHVYAEKMPCS